MAPIKFAKLIVLVSVLTLVPVLRVDAEPITLQLEAQIDSILLDNAGLLPGLGVTSGSSILGSLTLDTDSIPLTPDTYISDGQVLGSLSLFSGGLEITSDGMGGLMSISRQGDTLHFEFEDVRSNFGFFDMISMNLIADGLLPEMPLSTLSSTSFVGGNFHAGLFSLPQDAIDFTASLTSVSVPEPATVAIVGLGMGIAAAFRRRHHRKKQIGSV